MIGRVPRALARVYIRILLKSCLGRSKKLMGYVTPNTKELLLSLGGQPYIDTDLFHSFLPAGISQSIEKLVNKWSILLPTNRNSTIK